MGILETFGQTANSADGGGVIFFAIVYVALIVLIIVSEWKVYAKAGRPGWAALIPIYNIYVLLKIAGRPGWWLLLYLVPLVNVVVSAIVSVDLAKAFDRSTMFGIFGLWLFAIVGYPMLAFGEDTYTQPSNS